MKLTATHLSFWRKHTAGTPTWANRFNAKDDRTIHFLIASNAGERIDTEPDNCFAILRSERKLEGKLLPYLIHWSNHGWLLANKPKRAKAYRRWALRIIRDQAKGGESG